MYNLQTVSRTVSSGIVRILTYSGLADYRTAFNHNYITVDRVLIANIRFLKELTGETASQRLFATVTICDLSGAMMSIRLPS